MIAFPLRRAGHGFVMHGLNEVGVQQFVCAADFGAERQRVEGQTQFHYFGVREPGIALAGCQQELAFGREPNLFRDFGAHVGE